MQKILCWVFAVLFVFSSFRVVISMQTMQEDYTNFLPNATTEIPYDEEGNKLTFYEYYKLRKSRNYGYLSLGGILDIFENFEHFEFSSITTLKLSAVALKEISKITFNVGDTPSNTGGFSLQAVMSFLTIIVRSLITLVLVTQLGIQLIVPIVNDVLSLTIVVMDLLVSLLAVTLGFTPVS